MNPQQMMAMQKLVEAYKVDDPETLKRKRTSGKREAQKKRDRAQRPRSGGYRSVGVTPQPGGRGRTPTARNPGTGIYNAPGDDIGRIDTINSRMLADLTGPGVSPALALQAMLDYYRRSGQ